MRAIAILDDSLEALRREGSPLATTALVDLGGHYYHAGKHLNALQRLDEADRDLNAKQWPLQSALAAWNRGVAFTSLGRIEGAADAYQRAIDLYRQAGDKTHLGMLEMLVAHNAEMAHNTDAEWSHYIQGVTLADRYGEPERLLVVLDTFCRAALRADQPGFATILDDAILARSTAPAWQPYRCHALITRCDVELRRGKRHEAAEQCRAATAAFSSIVDVAIRDRLEADLELSSAAVSEHGMRIENLSRAVDVSVRRKDLYRLSRVLLARGRAYVEAGATALARVDFERGLQFLEEQRELLESVPDRLTFFETSSATSRELVRLLVAAGEEEEALRVVERVRARALIDEMAAPASSQMSLADAQSQIEPGQALLEYWADDRELFIWIVRNRSIKLIRHSVPRRTLNEQAQRLVDAMSPTASDDPRPAATILYRHLVVPLEPFLARISTLTIIPDDVIADVPFNVLSETPRGPFLIERFSVSGASSASSYAIAHARTASRDSILIVANPDTGGSFPALEVHGEIEAAKRALRRTIVFSGADATAAAIRGSARRYDVLHIATHALRESSLGEPALVLASGLLSASDVEKTITVRNGGLVVLAACSTSRGRKSADGNLSLARAFVAAGASIVVASLWDADDGDSDRLFRHFYEEIGRGSTPAAALRSAQIAMLHSESNVRPQRWAAYHIWGGV